MRRDRGCGGVEKPFAVGAKHRPELIRRHSRLTADERRIDRVDQPDLSAHGRGEAGCHLERVRGELASVDGDEDMLEFHIDPPSVI
jgi:hypothetical protein